MADQGGATPTLRVTSAVIAFVLGLTACSAASPSPSPRASASSSAAASTSPSAAASESASPSARPPTSSSNLFSLLPADQPADFVPEIACTGEIGASDPVAIVRMLGVGAELGPVVLRDYADLAHPATVCTGLGAVRQLVDARHVVIPGNGAWAVVDLPELRYHWFALPDPREFLAVGPQLDQVVWKLTDYDGGEDTYSVTTSAGDQLIASLPTPGTGRCGSPEMDSRIVAYTLSGSLLFILNQPIPEFNSLVVPTGQPPALSLIPPTAGWPDGAGPLMALWSPTTETLYYRQADKIWSWTDGSEPQLFLADTRWVQPTISPDGTHLAYSVLRPTGDVHDSFLIDLTAAGSPTPRKIGLGPRKLPVFLNSTQLWFKSEGEDHGCAGAEAEKPLIYDIVDDFEFPSVIDQPMLVWPATSANF